MFGGMLFKRSQIMSTHILPRAKLAPLTFLDFVVLISGFWIRPKVALAEMCLKCPHIVYERLKILMSGLQRMS